MHALDTSLFLFARELRLKFIASQYPSSNQTPSVSLGLTDLFYIFGIVPCSPVMMPFFGHIREQ
jgi:hypothetical protein